MDNFFLDVIGEGDKQLKTALSLALRDHLATTVSIAPCVHDIVYHYQDGNDEPISHTMKIQIDRMIGVDTMFVFWGKCNEIRLPHDFGGEMTGLPFELDEEALFYFVKGWLTKAKIPPAPRFDGSVERGWRVFTDQSGGILHSPYGLMAIQPAWALFGK